MSKWRPSEVKMHIHEVMSRKDEMIEKRDKIKLAIALLTTLGISPGQMILCLFIPECLLLSS